MSVPLLFRLWLMSVFVSCADIQAQRRCTTSSGPNSEVVLLSTQVHEEFQGEGGGQ